MEGDKLKSEARVTSLVRVLLDGATTWDIREFVAEQEKDPASPWFREQPRKYCAVAKVIRAARKLIAAEGIGDREQLLADHVAKRRVLFATAVKQGDIRSALACLDSEAKLLGLGQQEEKGTRNATTINIFERAAIIAAQLPSLDARIPARLVHGDSGGEPLDQANADAEAIGIPVAS